MAHDEPDQHRVESAARRLGEIEAELGPVIAMDPRPGGGSISRALREYTWEEELLLSFIAEQIISTRPLTPDEEERAVRVAAE